jgi:hypothetical protein
VLNDFKEEGLYKIFQQEVDASLLTSILYVFNLVNKAQKDSPLQDAFASFIQDRFPAYGCNPLILKENKAAIQCILDHRYTWYHFRFLLKQELIESLLGMPFLAKLNHWRKQLLSK